MESNCSLESISDDELLRRLADLLRRSRRVEAELVAHIGEVDQRGLYAREAQPSMFAYCTEVLRLSEAEAYLRIAAARAARAHPVLLGMLGDGRLHLTAIAKLAPHLTRENRDRLLQQATHRSKRQIEELVAALAPRPDVTATMRRLPERKLSAEASRERGLDSGASSEPVEAATASGRRCLEAWSDCGGGAFVARPVQGAVHRFGRAPKQARATAGADAPFGARRRSGRDHRTGGDREAGSARGAPLREGGGSPQGRGTGDWQPGDETHSGGRPAGRGAA